MRMRSWYVLVVTLYIVCATALAANKLPWVDEAWYASPAINALRTGSFGTPNFWMIGLPGVRSYTYWEMPGFIMSLVPWLAVFGTSLAAARAFTIVLGGAVLFVWERTLAAMGWPVPARGVALLLMAAEDLFLLDATYARSDMLSLLFMVSALCSYVRLREANFRMALLASQAFAVAAGLVHPNAGLLSLVALAVLAWPDRRRFRLDVAPLLMLPYVIGALLWGAYISQAPELWIAQLSRNSANRFLGNVNPIAVVIDEVVKRYLTAFGWGPHTAGTPRLVALKGIVLALWVAGVVGCCGSAAIRKDVWVRRLLLVLLASFLFFAFFENKHTTYYLIWFVPTYSALAGRWVHVFSSQGGWRRSLAVSLCLGALAVSLAAAAQKTRRHLGMQQYWQVVEHLRTRSALGPIAASVEFGFALGFGPGALVDDISLGTWSRIGPRTVVVGLRYDEYMPIPKVPISQDVHEAAAWLRSDCVIGMRNSDYRVYHCPERVLPSRDGPIP
ncbi:MAG: hypothetical protein IT361_01305 [Gemmatimonadaceae bacterium]|nr:hypothetical protein [Gemmatimonadaceae bacterium]